MLTNLHVKNLALVKETEVNLTSGFNVITGETGAGKSIIIGSVALALGGKADKDMIRDGEEYALIELTFTEDSEVVKNKLTEMELPEEEGSILITRKILPARSIYRINGETVTAKQVKDLAELLIDIHGQHEHQSLIKESKQKALLDDYAGEKLAKKKADVKTLYSEYKNLLKQLEDLSMDESERERTLSLAIYEAEEIENADLKPGEGDEIRDALRKLQNGQKIETGLQTSLGYLSEGEGNALDAIGYVAKELNSLKGVDDTLDGLISEAFEIEDLIRGLSREMSRYEEDLSFDEETFDTLETRLDLIDCLTMKYGKTEEEVLAYGEKRREEISRLKDLAGTIETIEKAIAEKEKAILKCCEEIHKERVAAAKELSGAITDVLVDLNFLKVSFQIAVTQMEQFSSDGYDQISYEISLNPGEKARALSEVASGGELSRIMLALKCVFARKDAIGTLIFDEIDTGISGKTAWNVAERMAELSMAHQVICITHLPQIAAFSDAHFEISKKETEGKTITALRRLAEEQSVAEIARVLAADQVTDAVMQNAAELRAKALEEKSSKQSKK